MEQRDVGHGCTATARPDQDPESAAWVAALSDTRGRRYEEACERLHAVLLRIARSELRRRGSDTRITGPELDDLAHQAAADALLAITRKLADFRGESRFTTWAYRFVILEVSAKTGRHFWRRPTETLGAEDWDRLPDRLGLDPARETQWRDLVRALREAVDEVLTPHQRQVFLAVVVDGVPLDALVTQWNTNRNAVYKTVFDARRKLRAHLVAHGHLERKAGAS
ncbi:RNA polymerase sigma factor [Actinacidiphila acidipaludis]|uniref:RNA polymerase sigma factor n=1 Tax=Actinacidiphila acidipaludis TaxID=2873382 RepID=UPI00223C2077|nr:sigma-70 family RNA polymerase sigma factor [Streptomyces acidipaludis]